MLRHGVVPHGVVPRGVVPHDALLPDVMALDVVLRVEMGSYDVARVPQVRDVAFLTKQ